MEKRIIGRIDIAKFPLLKLDAIAVKIDTGAYTSSIHCHEIKIKKDVWGKERLSFRLLDPEHEQYHGKRFECKTFEKKSIKNSFGEVEERFVIHTQIELFQRIYPIELTLTDRGNMKFPVLLGRKILDHFLVDVSRTNLSFKESLSISQ